MKKLYIIGNGFDLYHKIKTKYSDFQTYISENEMELENFFEQYFEFDVDEIIFGKILNVIYELFCGTIFFKITIM
jgi:hypothetical protein